MGLQPQTADDSWINSVHYPLQSLLFVCIIGAAGLFVSEVILTPAHEEFIRDKGITLTTNSSLPWYGYAETEEGTTFYALHRSSFYSINLNECPSATPLNTYSWCDSLLIQRFYNGSINDTRPQELRDN